MPVIRVLSMMRNWRRNNATYDATETRQFLSKFGGGSIDLVKDDQTGIANVVINHVQRKNAFSGETTCVLILW